MAQSVGQIVQSLTSTANNLAQQLQTLPPGVARQLAQAMAPQTPPPAAQSAAAQAGSAMGTAAAAPGNALSATVAQAMAAAGPVQANPMTQGVPAPAQLTAAQALALQSQGSLPPGAPQAFAARADAALPAQASQPFLAGSPLAQSPPANPALVPQMRADAPLAARAEGGVIAERALSTAPGTTGATTAAAGSTVATPAAVAPPGATQAAVATALPQAVPPSQSPADARGTTMLTAGERVQGRTDAIAVPGHTLDGTQQRRQRGARQALAALMGALGLRLQAQRERHTESEQVRVAERIFQWLYWVLAIVAYACLVMSIVIFLPVFDGEATAQIRQAPTAWIGGFATIGLFAGVGAWMLARRLR